MKNVAGIAVAAVIAGVVVFAVYVAFMRDSGAAPGEGAAAGSFAAGGGRGGALMVRTQVISPQLFERTLRLNGTLLPREGIEVRSEVSGIVEQVAFREGQFVEAGTPLLRLDDRELQAELRSVKAELELAERNEARLADLLARGASPQRDYDEAFSRLNVLRARVELLETRIAKSALHAPFGGVVGLRRVSPGDFINSQQVITILNDIDALQVDFSVPERHQQELRVGLSIRILAGGIEEPRLGTIRAIEPQVDVATRTITARAVVNNDDRRLLPGNFAEIELVFSVNDDAVLIPTTAIIPGLGATRVFVIKDDKAEERVVQLGTRLENHVEILEGVSMGEEVVVRGGDGLRSGQAIRRQQS